MKTGNGSSPNPRKLFGGGYARDKSNEVKNSVGASFTAKKDSFKGKKKHG